MTGLRLGLDLGSTTVKAVAVEAVTGRVCWKGYRRHHGRQAQHTLELFGAMERELPQLAEGDSPLFLTGSGGGVLAQRLGAVFVQEVTALALAVEAAFPDTGSVIELGGQDAKFLLFRRDPRTGRTTKSLAMNDKCAGGTGVLLDRMAARLGLSPERLARMDYAQRELHPVAGKCGVFAETDVNGLQKRGVAVPEIAASLFHAVVQQNLGVLTRGRTPLPQVLLLGGPNRFFPGLVEAWRANIDRLWRERALELPEHDSLGELIRVPEDACFFAAIGAVGYGGKEGETIRRYPGLAALRRLLQGGGEGSRRRAASGRGLARDADELRRFRARYAPPVPDTARAPAGQPVQPAFLGIDAGSTSTKAVLLAPGGQVLGSSYGLSAGDPIEDAMRHVAELCDGIGTVRLEILGVGVTGYAGGLLGKVLQADATPVETIAHAASARHFHGDVDVICDVGGQDIKLIFLADGRVRDFRLNAQCSAGTGYFLESTCRAYGIALEDFAEVAFSATDYPRLDHSCGVFLQSQIVDLQRQGWQPHEILAGLAAVLPRNIWLHVARIPSLRGLGSHFVLQGGLQRNLAAVKAQVDFIRAGCGGEGGRQPRITVHRYAAESGAIGAALEARARHRPGQRSRFIGLAALQQLHYAVRCDESTHCSACGNRCARTFIELRGETGSIISAPCELGSADDRQTLQRIEQERRAIQRANPNLAEYAARRAWEEAEPRAGEDHNDNEKNGLRLPWRRGRRDRSRLRVGIPRVLNLYALAPFFTAYLTSLGLRYRNLVFSDHTSAALYRAGAARITADPCFPAKLGVVHVHDLLERHHRRRPLDWILFPMVDGLPPAQSGATGARACPTVTVTPEVVKAAFGGGEEVFGAQGIRYVSPFVNFAEPDLLVRQMHRAFAPLLGLGRGENRRACARGWQALAAFERDLRERGRTLLALLERERRLGLVLLGRPYHGDPGINQGILRELQRHGYPILGVDTLPREGEPVLSLFAADIRQGHMRDSRDISDLWDNAYSEYTNRKLWAAKVAARHPLLVGLELSSFKCGMDAPVQGLVEEILRCSGTPLLGFRDLDENRPDAALRIRITTHLHTLAQHARQMGLHAPAMGSAITTASE